MPIELTPMVPLSGEDESVRPKFQMVPLGGERAMRYLGDEMAAAGLSDLTSRVGVVPAGSGRLILRGLMPGWANLQRFGHGGPGPTVLQVAVLPLRAVRVAFRYVAAGSEQTTARPIPDGAQLLTGAGALLLRQANVQLVNAGTQVLALPSSLGPTIDVARRSVTGEEQLLRANKAPDADVTVFFVRALDIGGNTANEAGVARASAGIVVLEDHQTHSHARALAHELVHALGVPGHLNGVGSLMGDGLGAAGRPGLRLTRDQIMAINPLTSQRPR